MSLIRYFTQLVWWNPVSETNQLPVIENWVEDANNSTDTILWVGGVFTWTVTDVLNYWMIIISVYTDQASATDWLVIEFSQDGLTHWHWSDEYTINALSAKTFSVQPQTRYMRVRYTNWTVAQTAFEIVTTLKPNYVKPSSHRIQDSIIWDDDAELTKSVLSWEDQDWIFQNVQTTRDWNLTISDNSSWLSIAQANVTWVSFIHKFWAWLDFDVADWYVTVWDWAEDWEPYEKMVYTYSTTADIDTLSSDTAGNSQLTEIQWLDADYNLVIQNATLNWQNAVTLTTPLIRVFRVKNIDSTDYAWHVFVSVSWTLSWWVPTSANLRAVVHWENNQTEMAVFTIPAWKTWYMRDWYASTAWARRDSAHTVRVIARPFWQVFQLKHTSNIDVNWTGYIKHNYTEPEVFSEKTDIEIRMNTNQNIAWVSAWFDIVLIDN